MQIVVPLAPGEHPGFKVRGPVMSVPISFCNAANLVRNDLKIFFYSKETLELGVDGWYDLLCETLELNSAADLKRVLKSFPLDPEGVLCESKLVTHRPTSVFTHVQVLRSTGEPTMSDLDVRNFYLGGHFM